MILTAFEARAASAFALALLGGAHCAGMCGGFVVALHGVAPRQERALRFAIAYNAGRVTSYTAGGALAGLAGAGLYASRVLPLQVGLLVLGAAMLLVIAASMWSRPTLLNRFGHAGAGFWRLLQPLARGRFPPKSVGAALAIGLAWGWIPCGMVYAALPLALVSGGVLQGAAVMLAFGLGTLPNLGLMQIAAAKMRKASGKPGALAWLRPVAGVVLVLFAASDLAHAAQVAGLTSPSLAWLAAVCHG
jgi:uncharacterized protein